MTKRSKSYRAAAEKGPRGRAVHPLRGHELAKETTVTKFDSTVEVVFRLGVDPRKADQMVRGTVSLPHGTGKTARVLVFAVGPRAQEAIDAGADEVGGDELIEKVAKGYTDFDVAVATPDLMGKVGRLGRILGPPWPHAEPQDRHRDHGRRQGCQGDQGRPYRVPRRQARQPGVHRRQGLLHRRAADRELRRRPGRGAASQADLFEGRYLLKGAVATTMGPGIPLDVTKVKDLIEK